MFEITATFAPHIASPVKSRQLPVFYLRAADEPAAIRAARVITDPWQTLPAAALIITAIRLS